MCERSGGCFDTGGAIVIAGGIGAADLFTSKTGVFAAVVAVAGLLVAVQTLLRPHLLTRRERREAGAELRITPPQISRVAISANSCELRYEVINSGGRAGVMRSTRLRVTSVVPSETYAASLPEAPLVVHKHRVELGQSAGDYEIRSGAFTVEEPPLRVAEGDGEAFLVKLVSLYPLVYRFVVEVIWYDVKVPGASRTLRSDEVVVDFPHRRVEIS